MQVEIGGVGRVTAKTALPPYKTECASQYPANMLRLRARLAGTAPTPRCVFFRRLFSSLGRLIHVATKARRHEISTQHARQFSPQPMAPPSAHD